MPVAGRLFAALGAFFGLTGVVYLILSHEPAGSAALLFTAGLGLLIAFYLLFTAKRLDQMPEDDAQGDIDQGAGDQGFYSPHSWWPLPLGLGAATIGMGLVFTMWWLIGLGVAATLYSVSGLLFEYYRADFARE